MTNGVSVSVVCLFVSRWLSTVTVWIHMFEAISPWKNWNLENSLTGQIEVSRVDIVRQ